MASGRRGPPSFVASAPVAFGCASAAATEKRSWPAAGGRRKEKARLDPWLRRRVSSLGVEAPAAIMQLPGCCHANAVAMLLPGCCHANAVAMLLPRCRGIAVSCRAAAVELPWSCHAVAASFSNDADQFCRFTGGRRPSASSAASRHLAVTACRARSCRRPLDGEGYHWCSESSARRAGSPPT